MPEHLIRLMQALYSSPAHGATDTELVARVANRDDSAFELLVRRHAGLVWRTCRAVARHHHAAEDAFQATFLALATKAGTIRGPVVGWLYRVAYHAALKARPTPRAPLTEPPAPMHDLASAEAARVLHAELARLPAEYRDPVLLCHLQGLTQTEAAHQLGVPLGTIATRVRRGLDRLRVRLAARGLAPALVLSVVDVSATPSLMAVDTIPDSITRLSEGALAAMSPTSGKLLAATALALVSFGLTVGFAAWPTTEHPAQPPAPAKAAAPAVPKPAEFWQARASLDNLRKIGIAMHAYCDAHKHFPRDITDKTGQPILSWRVALLPYLDQRFLHTQFKLDEPWDSEHNRKLLAFMPDLYRARVQPLSTSETYCQVVAGTGTVFDPAVKVTFTDILDGTSNTLLVVEAGPAVPWTQPADRVLDAQGNPPELKGPYTDATHAVLADGSTYRLKPTIDAPWRRLLILRDDATPIPMDVLFAAPAKPSTDAERKLLVEQRQYLIGEVRRAAVAARHRLRVEQEMKKHGEVALPDPTRLETLQELEDLAKDLNNRSWSDNAEAERLMKLLRKIDPMTAKQLDEEHEAERLKLVKPLVKD